MTTTQLVIICTTAFLISLVWASTKNSKASGGGSDDTTKGS
jgi:hypothetical protein